MRQLVPLALCAVLASAVVGAAAQTGFSGRWTTDPDPAAQPPAAAGTGAGAGPQRAAGPGQGGPGRGGARGDMGSGWGPTISITQDATRLMVEYAFFARGDMQPPLRFNYALDGSETKNTVMMGHGMQTQTARTKWDGAKLVITTRHSFVDPATSKPATLEVTQTLSLESPTSLVVETTRAVAGRQATTAKTVYRKL
jgi:hypothetical protein